MTVSGGKIWLTIADMEYIVKHLPYHIEDPDMEYIVKHLPSPHRRPQWENIEELKVKLRLKLGDIRRYNEVDLE